jgi:hypothetical protein
MASDCHRTFPRILGAPYGEDAQAEWLYEIGVEDGPEVAILQRMPLEERLKIRIDFDALERDASS